MSGVEGGTIRGCLRSHDRRAPAGPLALFAFLLALLAVPTPVHADELTRCTTAAKDRTLCGRVTVPLDRGGALPGVVSLRVRALPPARGVTATGTVLALAGGPGQAAVPLLDAFASALGPSLRTRRLVTFDQRGTGGSGRLRCAALTGKGSIVSVVGRCASELGPGRAAYTTAASVADVEAVRVALGVDRLILYGASYGTKVALSYAAAYPDHVERLVLDSTVPPEGIDPFQRSTIGSIPRMLATLCAHACSFTRSPGRDVATLARRLARAPLRGSVIDGSGRPRGATITEAGLLGLLLTGDFDRYLRAALPAAVRAAVEGDAAPLLRLTAREVPDTFATGDDSDAVYAATTCEDGGVPWPAGTPLEQRRALVNAAAAAIPDAAFAPFDRATVRALGTVDLCRGWPEAPIVQPLPSLPATPALILSGDEDLRTPRADAVALAARLSGAQLLRVPDAGHGVLFSDPTDCTERAIETFLDGGPAGSCRPHPRAAPPLALAPRRLGDMRSPGGLSGRAGRTVTAVVRTLDDATDQLIAQVLASGQARPFGGLRAGNAELERNRGMRLRGYAYVPGVTVSGLVPVRGSRFTLVVGGRDGAHGRVTLTRSGITGRLDGRSIDVSARDLGWRSPSASAAAMLGHAPAPLAPPSFASPLLARRASAAR